MYGKSWNLKESKHVRLNQFLLSAVVVYAKIYFRNFADNRKVKFHLLDNAGNRISFAFASPKVCLKACSLLNLFTATTAGSSVE